MGPALGEQLASWSRGVASGRISYSAGWVAVPCRAGQSSPEPHRLHVSAHGGAAAASLVAESGGGLAVPVSTGDLLTSALTGGRDASIRRRTVLL